MNIIISPAKKMNEDHDDILSASSPVFLEKTEELFKLLKSFSYEDLKKILCCSDEIAELNYERYKHMNLHKNLTPAILAYEGIQYKYMSPNSFDNNEFDYVNEHLKILSAFYGILKPNDGVVPYRLEMMAKLKTNNFKNLYDFWGDLIYKELYKDTNIVLNLASKEYSKVVEKYIKPSQKFISCIFGNLRNGKIKVKATEAKMARGLMVRFLAENNISDIDEILNYSGLGFSYSREFSSENALVFLK